MVASIPGRTMVLLAFIVGRITTIPAPEFVSESGFFFDETKSICMKI